jgi:hypothetical protein
VTRRRWRYPRPFIDVWLPALLAGAAGLALAACVWLALR